MSSWRVEFISATGAIRAVRPIAPEDSNEHGGDLDFVVIEAPTLMELAPVGYVISDCKIVEGHVVIDTDGIRQGRLSEIDSKTSALVAKGFAFGNARLSLSPEAQAKLLSYDTQRESLTYPVVFNTIDDDGTVEVKDAGSLHSLALAAITALRAAVDSGTLLKQKVRSMADVKSIREVVDDR